VSLKQVVSFRSKEQKPKPGFQDKRKEEVEDFSDKWVGKKVLILMSDNSSVNAKITDNSKYYLEVVDLNTNKVTYIHKPFIRKIIIEE
jgi:hypothetical protein